MIGWTIESLAGAIRAGKVSPVEATQEASRGSRGSTESFAPSSASMRPGARDGPPARGRPGGAPGAGPSTGSRSPSRTCASSAGARPPAGPRPRSTSSPSTIHRGRAARRRGRGDARQAQHERAGDGAVRRQCPPRARPEPVARRALRGRLLERLGGRGGVGSRAGRDRTDTGGSIRLPAAACGIVGLKPTYGRVSRAGAMPLSWSNDHVGPMARTVRDCAVLLQVMAGPDPRDATSSPERVPDYLAALGGPAGPDLTGMRVGVGRELLLPGRRRRGGGCGAQGGGRPRAARSPRRGAPRAGSADDERRHEHRQPLRVLRDPRSIAPRPAARGAAGRALPARARTADPRPRLPPGAAPAGPSRADVRRGGVRPGGRAGRPGDPGAGAPARSRHGGSRARARGAPGALRAPHPALQRARAARAQRPVASPPPVCPWRSRSWAAPSPSPPSCGSATPTSKPPTGTCADPPSRSGVPKSARKVGRREGCRCEAASLRPPRRTCRTLRGAASSPTKQLRPYRRPPTCPARRGACR